MSKPDHLSEEMLVRATDDELSESETILVDSHLSRCEECRERYQKLRALSVDIESALAVLVPEHSSEQRESLSQALAAREDAATSPAPRKVLQQFGWGMAIAAMLTAAIVFGPQWARHRSANNAAQEQAQIGTAFEMDGETFIALPYSNPDLPVTASHIVQMQVSVSSLADAGIVFEPISNQVSAPDGSVLADVLLGIDGQPLGVHVVGVE